MTNKYCRNNNNNVQIIALLCVLAKRTRQPKTARKAKRGMSARANLILDYQNNNNNNNSGKAPYVIYIYIRTRRSTRSKKGGKKGGG